MASDLLRDLRDIITHGGSGLRRDLLLRKIRKFEIDCRRVGADLTQRDSQAKLCQALAADLSASAEEWMFWFVVARLQRGDFSDWTGWEYRNPFAVSSYRTPMRRWRLEKVQSIAALGEQGIGDEVMYASCLPELFTRISEVTFECEPRIQQAMERSFPGLKTRPRADVLERNAWTKYLSLARPEYCFIPVADLPRLFRKAKDAFPAKPYLVADARLVEKWNCYKGRTGIAWRGRTGQFRPAELQVGNPICLQYDAWPAETKDIEVPPVDLHDDIEDLLGILANLSRLVCVPQTTVHLAGAMGLPVDVIMPPVGSGRKSDQFRWRYIDPMPWYANVRVFQSLSEYRQELRHRRYERAAA